MGEFSHFGSLSQLKCANETHGLKKSIGFREKKIEKSANQVQAIRLRPTKAIFHSVSSQTSAADDELSGATQIRNGHHSFSFHSHFTLYTGFSYCVTVMVFKKL